VQGTTRIVYFAYLILGALLAVTVGKTLSGLAYALEVNDPAVIGPQFTVTTLMGVIVGVAAGVYAVQSARAWTFSTEVAGELRKVTWPTKAETQRSTVVVIVTTLVISLLLGLFDYVWAQLTGIIYS